MSTQAEKLDELSHKNFPFKCTLSLTNIIGYWQVLQNDSNSFYASTAKEVLKRIENVPALLKPIEDMTVVYKNKDLIDLIMSAIYPPASEEGKMSSVMIPFTPVEIYSTPAFEKVMAETASHESMLDELETTEMMSHKVMNAYATIMQMYYGKTIPLDRHFIYNMKNPETGLNKYYKADINPMFCEVIATGDLPELSQEAIKHLEDNLYKLDVWMEYLPPKLFEFQGVVKINLTDVTTEEVKSRIKDELLQKDSIIHQEGFDQLEEKFKSLLQLENIKLGIAAYQKGKGGFVNYGNRIVRSILLGDEQEMACSVTNSSLYEWFQNNQDPFVIEDLSKSDTMGGYEEKLVSEGVNNLLLGPLIYNNEFVGLLELASPNVGDLQALSLNKIKDVLPLFAVAVKRSSEEFENRIESIIKKKYTSIHPTVEWKFTAAARDIIIQEEAGLTPVPKPIVFEDVYPLYAASDIRNSSLERNKAINEDLKFQLQIAKLALKAAKEFSQLPILEETIFRLKEYETKLKRKMVTGDEVTIVHFLQSEVEPIINNIKSNIPAFGKAAQAYFNELNEELGIVYKSRKNFEESLTRINEEISVILDEEEIRAQKMFPHFFEKYKTDGVEYNIYIGSALTEKLKFDNIYLKNMRLWQLMVTVEIANKVAAIKDQLSLPLDTTHLILVHNAPLSIRFRMDEKKFDVDGAYNIRYEIIKKRIDKALIEGTDERITQPGKIAIVYSQEKDAKEYLAYINFLSKKGFLKKDVEDVKLEELQGVSGLRALRVSVNIPTESIMDEVESILQRA
jgi:hypothetical protein